MTPQNKPLLTLTLTIAVVSAAVAWGGSVQDRHGAPAAVAATGMARTAISASPAVRKNRAAVVAASKAWLATLSSDQNATATYDFSDTTAKQSWSNFPAFFKPRTGVAFSAMNSAQTGAANALAKAALSRQGYKAFIGTREADTAFAATTNQTSDKFGAGNYYVSIFGTPSRTAPFMVSFNGHHMSFNITYNSVMSSSPEFTGVDPANFQLDGKTVQPMKLESSAVFALLPKLPAAAKLAQSFDDVLVGPQKDGQFPTTPSGVKVTSLPKAARAQVTNLIKAYVGDVDESIGDPIIKRYAKQYAKTYVSYAGTTTDAQGTYLRIDGPGVWIEFAVQASDANAPHYHSVYRDKNHDYGT